MKNNFIAISIVCAFIVLFTSCEKEDALMSDYANQNIIESLTAQQISKVEFNENSCQVSFSGGNNLTIPVNSVNFVSLDASSIWRINGMSTGVKAENTPPSVVYNGQFWTINSTVTEVTTYINNSSGIDYILYTGSVFALYLTDGSVIECPIYKKTFKMYRNSNGDFLITREFNEVEDFTISIGQCGVNNLYQIKGGGYYLKDGSPTAVGFGTGTDWIGPYIVQVIPNEEELISLNVYDKINGYYVAKGGALVKNGSFNVKVYKVEAGDVILLDISGGVGSSIAWSLYSDFPISTSTLMKQGGLLKYSNGRNTVTVSNDGYLAVSIYPATQYSVSKADHQYEYNNSIKQYTGGFHGSNGDGTGIPTAKTNSIRVTADYQTYNNNIIEADNIKLVVYNTIKCCNAIDNNGEGRDAIDEIVTYEFKEDKIHVSVWFTALTKIKILTYYGLQVPKFRREYYFITGDVSYHAPGGTPFSVPYQTDYIIAYHADGERRVIAHLDKIGLGTGHYSDTNAYSFCTRSKAYYSLIGGQSLELNAGESGYWQGWYSFVN